MLKLLILYYSQTGNTEKMARSIVEGVSSEGVEASLFRIPFSDRGDIIKELLGARGILIGSSTINNGVLPTVAPFLEELQGLRPRNKIAAAFGAYGWGGGAVRTIEEKMEKAGMEIAAPALTVRWVPDKGEIRKCFEFGREFAKKVAKIE